MNLKTWITRSAALIAAAGAVLAVTGPTAEAGQTGAVVFTVQANVAAACTATSGGTFSFGNYTSGQAGALNGEMDVDITCPGSSNASPMPVTLQVKPIIVGAAVGFEMSQNGTGAAPYLTYQLCNDAACATPYGNNVPGPSVSEIGGASAQTYQLFGQIAGGQAPAASANPYQQTVNAFVNF